MNEQLDSIEAGSHQLAKAGNFGNVQSPERATSNTVGYLPRPPKAPKPPKRDDDEEDDGYFRRNRTALIIGAVLVTGLAWGAFHMPADNGEPAKKKEEKVVKIVSLPPPLPPPPPKVLPPPPPVEKKMVAAPVEKPADKPKAADEPPKGLGTSVKGSGPGMGLGAGRGLDGVVGGTGNGKGNAKLASVYAAKVGSLVERNLKTNPKTRSSNLQLIASVWADGSGRITKATLAGTTGDVSMDEVIKNNILTGQLPEPPPEGMKMPIKLRLTARRPSSK